MVAEVVQAQGTKDVRGLIWWSPGCFVFTNIGPNSNLPDVPYPDSNGCDPTAPNPPCIQGASNGVFGSRSRHPGVVQFVLCDGSARLANDTIDINIWRNLGSSQDAKTIGNY
jgi:hypothetical protein